MIVVQLEDGTTIYAFGRFSVFARNAAGAPDRHWQSVAESLTGSDGDLRAALTELPGARLIHEGQVIPPANRPAADGPAADPSGTEGSRNRR